MERDETLRLWIQQYADRLTHLGYTYLRDWQKAEDAVQEALIKAYRAMHQLNNFSNPYPWLARIVVNECRAIHRKTFREVITSLFPEKTSISSEEEYMLKADSRQIYDEIMSLPEVYRAPVFLYYIQELSTSEIADVLGINAGAVRTRLSRARERLQKRFRRGEKNEFGGTDSRCKSAFYKPYRG